MEEYLEDCRDCKGRGYRVYRIYDTTKILRNLIELKQGNSIERLELSSYIWTMPCRKCKRKGKLDWVTNILDKESSIYDLKGNIFTYYQNSFDGDGISFTTFDDRKEYKDFKQLSKIHTKDILAF